MEKNNIEKFKEEYENFNEILNLDIDLNNFVIYKNTDEVIDILKNKTGIVYFGFPMCPWCRNIVNILLDVAKKNNLKINYVDVMQLDGPDFKRLVPLIDDYLEYRNGKKILYSPDVYFVKEGKIIGHHMSTVKSQIDPRIYLNEKQTKELEGIYQNLINEMR